MTARAKPIVLIEAPSNLGLMPPAPGTEPGTRGAPDALRQLGLHDRLSPLDVTRIEAARYHPDDERTINIRNMAAIAEHAIRLADAVDEAAASDRFPLVIGGDCSLLVGSMLGLHRRSEETGLLFVDGHTDFFLPEQSATGGAAGMDLALVTGWGPPQLTDLEGRRPYVRPDRVAALGNRDHHKRRSAPIPSAAEAGFDYRPLEVLRAEGVARATASAVDRLGGAGPGYWIHLDVDVLDSAIMPAVDSPQADGLSWEELTELLRIALDGKALGMQVTIYDPDRDPGLAAGQRLVDALVTALSTGQPAAR